jgi:cysteine synthase A
MIEALEREGRITEKFVLGEPTSGNTGIALASVAAVKGYRLILTMPETMSMERRRMLLFLDAELELTPTERGMRGAIDWAQELVDELPDVVMPQQFDNPANPEIHHQTTAEEIWRDTGGRVDAFVTSVGTGGTLMRCSALLKARNPDIRIVAVEAEDSPVLSGGWPGQHLIEGTGVGFIPLILDTGLVDGVIPIANETVFRLARRWPLRSSSGERPEMSG